MENINFKEKEDGKKKMINKIINKIIKYPIRFIKKVFKLFKRVFNIFIKGVKVLWRDYHFIVPISEFEKLAKKLKAYLLSGNDVPLDSDNLHIYTLWIKQCETKTEQIELEYKPFISIVIPVYNVSKKLLSECIESILKQTYQNFEICLADDCSTEKETIKTLRYYEKLDSRIKVVYREKNGHISEASNSALEIATGEFVALMDNDDTIPSHALYEIVYALNKDKTIDFIYTDEDKLDSNGKRCYPHFKPDYSPDTLLSVNYFCHFTVLRTSVLREIGGWRKGFEGAQDWDLFLRFVEKTNNIYHIPKVLYHWRMIETSTSMNTDSKSYVFDASQKTLEEALERRNINGIVHKHKKVPYYWIEYIFEKDPLISIIIPTKDYASTLETCLQSIYKKTSYKNFEIIVVDNRSIEKETFELFDKYKKEHSNFKVIKADMEFNYSKINNLAVKEADGDYILLLNNDTEVITEDWLQHMVGLASQPHIGAVGAKLIYPDNTIQHGGVIMGLGGVASHAFINDPMESFGKVGRLCVPFNFSVVTAACLMVSTKKFNQINGLNEQLKVAYNDVDFCLRLLEKGYYNIMSPMSELFHYESKSRGLEDTVEKKKRFRSEEKYIYIKWKDIILNDPMYNPNLSRRESFMLEVSAFE